MIEIKNLSKRIGDTLILDKINLSIKKGEIMGFLGPNGAGKTTTMKIITTFWTPSSGSIEVGGVDVVVDSLQARKKIGYLPENVPLYDEMRVYEYLKFVAGMRGIKSSEVKNKMRKAIDACGLQKVIKKPIEELSKGYKQRVGLAQAIIHEPDILILDEPTTGLDPNQILEIRELIKKIGKEKTVIFSTHILSEVSATCDRTVIINNGKIVAEGEPEELIKKVGGDSIIYVKIKGPHEEVLKVLNNMANVEKAEKVDQESEKIFGYNIIAKEGIDLREELSMAVMRAGWSILEFAKKEISLEDAFHKLTK